MAIKPLGDRVLVKPSKPGEKIKGGIIIPDTAKEKPQEGTVIAVGPGKIAENGNRTELGIKKGDKVIFDKYAGNEIKYDDTEYLLIHENDIIGIVE